MIKIIFRLNVNSLNFVAWVNYYLIIPEG